MSFKIVDGLIHFGESFFMLSFITIAAFAFIPY